MYGDLINNGKDDTKHEEQRTGLCIKHQMPEQW